MTVPYISPSDLALLRILRDATGAQGAGKRRDADVMQQTIRGIVSRIEEE